MGFLTWRGWDRLDDLDRRLGLRRQRTDASATRMRRLLPVVIGIEVVTAIFNAAQHQWIPAVIYGALVPLALLLNRRAVTQFLDRAGDHRGPVQQVGEGAAAPRDRTPAGAAGAQPPSGRE